MSKNIYIIFFYLCMSNLHAQVGINTDHPTALFHIDGAGDNDNEYPNANQVVNDFVVTKNGDVGIGTITPQNKIEINSGIIDKSGLRFTNTDIATDPNSKGIGVDDKGNITIYSFSSITGDVKFSISQNDHDGWYILDGRDISTLPTKAQQVALKLGYTTNIPDGRDRTLKGKSSSESIGDTGGSNEILITKNNLPNITLPGVYTGTLNTTGEHTHRSVGGDSFLLGGTTIGNNGSGTWNPVSQKPYSFDGSGGAQITATAGEHYHNFKTTTAVQLGNGLELDNRQPYLNLNLFIYLGN